MSTGFTGWRILQAGMHYRRHALEEATLIASLFNICCKRKRQFLNVVFVFVWLTYLVSVISVPLLSHSGASVYVWYTFMLYMIVELLVSHEQVCISACWILLEVEFYVLVAFHLTSLF